MTPPVCPRNRSRTLASGSAPVLSWASGVAVDMASVAALAAYMTEFEESRRTQTRSS